MAVFEPVRKIVLGRFKWCWKYFIKDIRISMLQICDEIGWYLLSYRIIASKEEKKLLGILFENWHDFERSIRVRIEVFSNMNTQYPKNNNIIKKNKNALYHF